MKELDFFKHRYNHSIKLDNFIVNRIGVLEAMRPGIVNRPNGSGDSLLMFFHSEVVVNTKKSIRKIPAGSMIYWEKCGHYYGNMDIPWVHSWIHFDGSGAQDILRRAGMQAFQIISPPAQMFTKLLAEIDFELCRIEPDMLIVRNRFETFVREIVRAGTGTKKETLIPKHMIAIRLYIEANHREALSLDQIARHFSISSPHLSAEFKRWFGLSPGKYLIEQRLHEAEILLTDHNLQISEIAERVGWSDIYHFSKIFKKHRGVTPSATRNKSSITRK